MADEKKAETLRDKGLREAAHQLWLRFQVAKKKYGMEYDKELDEYLEGLE